MSDSERQPTQTEVLPARVSGKGGISEQGTEKRGRRGVKGPFFKCEGSDSY